MAVFETARGGILREGLAFDYCDVAVVTNIGDGDHLGLSDINTPEELAKVKRCIVEAVSPDGLRRAQRQRSAGGRNGGALPRRRRVLRHRRRIIRSSSGIAAWAAGRSSSATARSSSPKATAKRPSSRSIACRLTRGGQIAFQVENSLASIAAAWSLGIPHGRDPRPGRIDRRRHRQGARPVQRPGDRRGDRGRRLRPQRRTRWRR